MENIFSMHLSFPLKMFLNLKKKPVHIMIETEVVLLSFFILYVN